MKRLTFAVAMLFASCAHADWQYTRWGMSIDQAVGASNGQLHAVTEVQPPLPDGSRLEAKGTYIVDGHSFNVVLFFGPRGLQATLLTQSTRGECGETFALLAKTYGQPIAVPGKRGVSVWPHTESGDAVTFTEMVPGQYTSSACSLQYESAGRATGL